jgi:hypothetical protein
VRSARFAAVGKGMCGWLSKIEFLYAAGAKISRSGRPIWIFNTNYYLDTVPLRGAFIFMSVWWRAGTDG